MAATMSATPGGYTADQEAAARRNLDAHGFTGITVDAAYRLLIVFAADPSPLFASSHVPSPQPPSASSRRSASGNTRRRRRRAEPSPVSDGAGSDGDVVSVPSPIATRPHPRAARSTPGAAGDSGSASGASVHSDDSAHDTSGSAADSGGGGGGSGRAGTGTGTGTGTVTASQQSTVSVLKMKGRALVSSSDESEEDILTASGVAHRSPSKRLTASGDSGSDSDGSVVRRRHTRSTVVVAATAVDATPSPVATRRSERTLSSRAQARRDAKARALKLLKRRKLAAELNRSGSDSDADDHASASGRKRKRRLVPVFANETKQQRELRELRDRAEFGLEHDKAREVFRVGAGYASRGCHTPMQRSHAVHVLCVAVPSCGCVGDVVAMLCRGEVKYASDPESDAASDSPEEMPLDKFIVDDDDALYVPTAARHAVSRRETLMAWNRTGTLPTRRSRPCASAKHVARPVAGTSNSALANDSAALCRMAKGAVTAVARLTRCRPIASCCSRKPCKMWACLWRMVLGWMAVNTSIAMAAVMTVVAMRRTMTTCTPVY